MARVSERLLKERVDASYYSAGHLILEEQLNRYLTLCRLSSAFDVTKLSGFEFTENFTSAELLSGTVPFITSENVRANSLYLDTCDCITSTTHYKLTRSQLKAGDIALSYTGHYRRAAVIPSSVGPLHLGPNVCKLSPRASADSYYVASFLNSTFGQRSLDREKTLSAQPTVNMERIRDISLPVPDELAQRYIGNKVQEADRLCQHARQAERRFVGSVLPDGGEIPIQNTAKSSRVGRGDLGRNLNAGAHTPLRRAIRADLKSRGALAVGQLAEISSPTTDSYNNTTPYIGLDAIDPTTCKLSPSSAGVSEVVGTVRALCEGPVISRLRPYLNKVSYIPAELVGAVGSTELFLVRPKQGVSGWYLYGVLKLQSSVLQLNPVATGSTHPRVDREDVLELLVPWHENQEGLGAKLSTAQSAYFASERLTTAATRLVESLIEGTLAEADLIAAQRGLEAGDREADRAVLRSLRRGSDADAPVLIPDVDALYVLLDEADDTGTGA